MKHLREDVKQIAVEFNEDAIHDLRTDFKKIRALLRWLGAKKNVYKPFDRIYDRAGLLRDIQVVNRFVDVVDSKYPEAFTVWLLHLEIHAMENWYGVNHKKVFKKMGGKLDKIKPVIHTRAFFSTRVKKIKNIIYSYPISDENMHSVRKMSKDMQYLLLWMDKEAEPNEPSRLFHLKLLKQIARQIGDYNDRCILLQFLTAYKYCQTEQAAILEIEPIIENQILENELEKDRLITSLRVTWLLL